MSTVAFDTSTPATVVAVAAGGTVSARRLEPPAGSRPGHSSELLAELDLLLGEAGQGWDQVELIGVGSGPGTFTGLRIGAATAEGLRRATGARVVAVDSLEAIALPVRAAHPGRAVCSVIDARRGEAFASGWAPDGERLFGPRTATPQALERLLGDADWLVAGRLPVEFTDQLASGVASWLAPSDPLNLPGGEALCRLAGRGPATDGPVRPSYIRAPDARRPGTSNA